MEASCCILVNSCDKFKDAWHPFFVLLRKYWADCPYKLYLNTESLTCGENNIVTLNSDSSSWTGRLIDSLNKINSNFVIFVLEDFFLMDYVKVKEIEHILKVMSDDPTIAVVYPKQISDYSLRDESHPEWIRMDYNRDKKYLLNCQFAIWNKKNMLDIIKPGLSPWALEREYKLPINFQYKFYCLPHGNKFSIDGDVFPYYFAIQKGYGIARSKWLWKNKSFFKKERIDVDFSSLDSLSYWGYMFNNLKKKLFSK